MNQLCNGSWIAAFISFTRLGSVVLCSCISFIFFVAFLDCCARCCCYLWLVVVFLSSSKWFGVLFAFLLPHHIVVIDHESCWDIRDFSDLVRISRMNDVNVEQFHIIKKATTIIKMKIEDIITNLMRKTFMPSANSNFEILQVKETSASAERLTAIL